MKKLSLILCLAAVITVLSVSAAFPDNLIKSIQSSSTYFGFEYSLPSLTQDGDKATSWTTIEDSPWIEFRLASPQYVGSIVFYETPMRIDNGIPNDIKSIAVWENGAKTVTTDLTWAKELAPRNVIKLSGNTRLSVIKIQILTQTNPKTFTGFSEILLLPPGTDNESDRFIYEDDVTKGVLSRQAYYKSEKQKTADILSGLWNKYPITNIPKYSSSFNKTSSALKLTRDMTDISLSLFSGCITSVRILDKQYTYPYCIIGNLIAEFPDGTRAEQKDQTISNLNVTNDTRKVEFTGRLNLKTGMPFDIKYTYYNTSGMLVLRYKYTGDTPVKMRRLSVKNFLKDSSMNLVFSEGYPENGVWRGNAVREINPSDTGMVERSPKPCFDWGVPSPYVQWSSKDHGFQVGFTDWRFIKGDYSGNSSLLEMYQSGNEKRVDACFISQLTGDPVDLSPGDEYGIFISLLPVKRPEINNSLILFGMGSDFANETSNLSSKDIEYVTKCHDWFPKASYTHQSWMPKWGPMFTPDRVKQLTSLVKNLGMKVQLYNDMRVSNVVYACWTGIVSYEDIKDATFNSAYFSVGSPGWRQALLNAFRTALEANQDPDEFYLDCINIVADLNQKGLSNVEGMQTFLEDLRILVNNYPAPKKRSIVAHCMDNYSPPNAALTDWFLPGEQYALANLTEIPQVNLDVSYNPYLYGNGIIAYTQNSYRLDLRKFYLGFTRYPNGIAPQYMPFVSDSRPANIKPSQMSDAEKAAFDKYLRPILEFTIGRKVNVIHPINKDYANYVNIISGNGYVTVYEYRGRSIVVITTKPGYYTASGRLKYKAPPGALKAKVSGIDSPLPVENGWISIDYNVDNAPVILDIIFMRQVASSTGFIKSGWNLISLPAEPVDGNPSNVLSNIDLNSTSLQTWDNNLERGGGYLIYNINWTGPMRYGDAYWLMEDMGKDISYQGIADDSGGQIVISARDNVPYWIMIGTPCDRSIECDKVLFNTSSDTEPVSWIRAGDSTDKGWIEAAAQGFDASTKGYFTVSCMGSSQKTMLEPWFGYWLLVKSKEQLTITFPNPQTNS